MLSVAGSHLQWVDVDNLFIIEKGYIYIIEKSQHIYFCYDVKIYFFYHYNVFEQMRTVFK